MALSNIFREPRREITESVAGVAVVIAVLLPAFLFGLWFQRVALPHNVVQGRILGTLFGAILSAVCLGALFFTHFVGEGICDALANRGLELRPKVRR